MHFQTKCSSVTVNKLTTEETHSHSYHSDRSERMTNEYTQTTTVQTDMRAVSFSGFNALNLTVYMRIFIWGHRPQQGARPPSTPRGDALNSDD